MGAKRDGISEAAYPIPARQAGSRLGYRQQEVLWAYAFMLPTIVGLVVFTLGPAIVSLALAFINTNLITTFRFVGLANFSELFDDDRFWISFANTVVYVVGHIVPTVALALGFAVALNQPIRWPARS